MAGTNKDVLACRAQLVSSDKQSVTDVAVKQFTPPFDRRAAEHEARVLQELEDKWYTMDLHNFYTAKLPAAGASSTEAEEECAFLVMGCALHAHVSNTQYVMSQAACTSFILAGCCWLHASVPMYMVRITLVVTWGGSVAIKLGIHFLVVLMIFS